jgi:hypothetical protein
VFVRLDDGKWTVENRAVLSELTRGLQGYQPSFFMHGLYLVTRVPGFVILSPRKNKEPSFFSIQLDTMEVALAPGNMGWMVYRSELPWPLALHTCC